MTESPKVGECRGGAETHIPPLSQRFSKAGLHLPRQRTPGGQGVKKIGLLVAQIRSLDQAYVKRILAAGNWRP